MSAAELRALYDKWQDARRQAVEDRGQAAVNANTACFLDFSNALREEAQRLIAALELAEAVHNSNGVYREYADALAAFRAAGGGK